MGTPPTLLLGVKPVSVSVPSPVSMTRGVAASAASSVAVRVTPPTVTEARPSGVLTEMVRVPVDSLSTFGSVRPASNTRAPPSASSGLISGGPSVRPLIVMLSVVLETSPSASVMV